MIPRGQRRHIANGPQCRAVIGRKWTVSALHKPSLFSRDISSEACLEDSALCQPPTVLKSLVGRVSQAQGANGESLSVRRRVPTSAVPRQLERRIAHSCSVTWLTLPKRDRVKCDVALTLGILVQFGDAALMSRVTIRSLMPRQPACKRKRSESNWKATPVGVNWPEGPQDRSSLESTIRKTGHQ